MAEDTPGTQSYRPDKHDDDDDNHDDGNCHYDHDSNEGYIDHVNNEDTPGTQSYRPDDHHHDDTNSLY